MLNDQPRYTIHFAEGGSAMRHYNEPLVKDQIITDGGEDYIVVRVEPPKTPTGIGQAWVELA
jgi:hypothetical protein